MDTLVQIDPKTVGEDPIKVAYQMRSGGWIPLMIRRVFLGHPYFTFEFQYFEPTPVVPHRDPYSAYNSECEFEKCWWKFSKDEENGPFYIVVDITPEERYF